MLVKIQAKARVDRFSQSIFSYTIQSKNQNGAFMRTKYLLASFHSPSSIKNGQN
jgi:hypothetical protein